MSDEWKALEFYYDSLVGDVWEHWEGGPYRTLDEFGPSNKPPEFKPPDYWIKFVPEVRE